MTTSYREQLVAGALKAKAERGTTYYDRSLNAKCSVCGDVSPFPVYLRVGKDLAAFCDPCGASVSTAREAQGLSAISGRPVGEVDPEQKVLMALHKGVK